MREFINKLFEMTMTFIRELISALLAMITFLAFLGGVLYLYFTYWY